MKVPDVRRNLVPDTWTADVGYDVYVESAVKRRLLMFAWLRDCSGGLLQVWHALHACMHAVSRPSPLTPTQSTEKRRSFAGPRCMSPPCSGYFRHRSAHASDDFRSQRTSASRRGDVAAKSTERYRRAMHEGNSKPGTERWMEIGDILERNVEYVVVFFCFFREGSSVRTQKWHYRQIPIFIVIPQISLEKTVTNTLPQDQISPIHCF